MAKSHCLILIEGIAVYISICEKNIYIYIMYVFVYIYCIYVRIFMNIYIYIYTYIYLILRILKLDNLNHLIMFSISKISKKIRIR